MRESIHEARYEVVLGNGACHTGAAGTPAIRRRIIQLASGSARETIAEVFATRTTRRRTWLLAERRDIALEHCGHFVAPRQPQIAPQVVRPQACVRDDRGKTLGVVEGHRGVGALQ